MKHLLVDTNVVLWLLLNDRDAVSATALEGLEDERRDIFLSPVCAWEIAIKRSTGKLVIEARWPVALAGLDLTPLPITTAHAAAVEHLAWHHRDPFDRLLVAQAQLENLAFVTADARVAAYGIDVVW